jgi:hypothetical protein
MAAMEDRIEEAEDVFQHDGSARQVWKPLEIENFQILCALN